MSERIEYVDPTAVHRLGQCLATLVRPTPDEQILFKIMQAKKLIAEVESYLAAKADSPHDPALSR